MRFDFLYEKALKNYRILIKYMIAIIEALI